MLSSKSNDPYHIYIKGAIVMAGYKKQTGLFR